MKKDSFNPKAFLNVKELTTQEDLMIRGGGKDKKKDQKKEKKKDADLDLDVDVDLDNGFTRP